MFSSNQVTSADIPWLADAQQVEGGATNFLSLGGATFNPTNPSQMILTGGTGVWTTTQVPISGATSSTPVTWTDQSVGIENLVANEIIVPPGGDPVLASWDRPFFKITNPNSYPTTYGSVASDNIVAGWSVDYASSSPSFSCRCIADWWDTEESGYSTTHYGQTWTKFPTEIPGAGSIVHGGNDRRQHNPKLHLGGRGRTEALATRSTGVRPGPPALLLLADRGGPRFPASRVGAVSTGPIISINGRSPPTECNTFYLYDPGKGVFETTNGGASWTNVHPGYIESNGSLSGFNSTIMSVPGEASNLFYTGGPVGTVSSTPANEPFYRSTNGGATWTAVPNVLDVLAFGFGAAAAGQSYPAIYIVGYVNSVYGIWQSTNNAQSWTNIGTYPNGELDPITTISGNPNVFGEVYVGFGDGGGYAYLPAGSTGGTGTGPTITGISESPATGDLNVGKTVALTLAFNENVTVAGGRPTLTLSDGGTAFYYKGSGTKTLTFNYTVAAGQSTASLAATAVKLASGVTIKDSAGHAANLSLAGLTQHGPQIDGVTPKVTSVVASPAKGDLNAGETVTLTLNFSEPVTVAGDATLNDRGGAVRFGGRCPQAPVAPADIASLAALWVNLASGATIKNSAGTGANLSLTGLTQTGPQIDTTAPTVTSVVASPAKGDLTPGRTTVTLTLNFSESVTVAGVKPTLTLNDRGTATYVSGSGSKALTFKYTVATGQNIASLAALWVNLASGAAIKDGAGTGANLSLTGLTQTGPQIDTTAPTVTSVVASPAKGDLNAGETVTLTLNFSESVTVAGVKPTLTLNDRGTATYVSGTGSKALTFKYTVAAGQNIASLAALWVNLASGATIKDGAGTGANLSLTGLTQTGPQIDTTAPTVTSVVASPAKGDLNAGDTVTLTLNFSEPVTLAGVAPTLTLNDRGTATYVSGSGSKALTFKYTVAAGQNIASLAALWVNLASGATIKDGAGTEANLSLTGLTQTGPQIDTIAPAVTSVVASPANGTQLPGDSVTITVKMSEAVTVGGAPTLSLNDGGSAKYISGSGTNTLTFKYTVGSSDRDVSALAISAVSLPAGAKILDGAGNVANMAGAIHSFAGLAVDPPIVTTKPDGSYDVAYSEVTGLSYSSYEDIYNSAGVQVAEARDLIGGAGTLVLDANQLSISSSSGSLGVTTGSDTFKVNSHANEVDYRERPGGRDLRVRFGFWPRVDYRLAGGRNFKRRHQVLDGYV